MNGNDLADILKYPGGEWRAGEPLPKEWWKTEFPYMKAEEMGYRLSPEETRRFYERKREKEKTLSEELADILKRPEVKMLDPLQRAELIDRVQKAQAAIAKREEEREKHEAEMMVMGREAQLREGVQDILQSDRVPAQKVTALTMAGVPLSEARKMVWGEREPEEVVERPREVPPRARPEELAGVLRPEPAKGVQFRMVDGELIKEPAGIWEKRLTSEQKIAKREAELKTAEYYRRRALERKYPKLAIPLEERKFTAEEKRLKREFEADVKELDRRYELDAEELGETKAENLRSYNLEKLKEDRTWEETLFDMGFKDKEFNELSKRFWDTQDFNKEKEETRAKEFDVEIEFDKEKEAAVMDRFEKELKQEYKRLNLDVERLGLNKEIEARIAKMALLEFGLDKKKLGLDEAILKWKRIAEKKEWWFRKEELRLKNAQAQRLFFEFIHRIGRDAKELGLEKAIHKENIRQFDEKMKMEQKKLEDKGEAKIEIGGNFGADLSGLGAELQNEVMANIKSTYNPKTGKLFFPNATQIKDVARFLYEIPAKKSKEQCGINLSSEDFIKGVMREPMWSPELKGWCIRSRYNENVWLGMCGSGSAEGVYITPEELGEPSLWEKVTGWWPFGREKKEEPTEKPIEKIDIEEAARRILTEQGIDITEAEFRDALKRAGCSEDDIDKLIRGM